MNISIFGATGMVGRQLVQQALFKGHTVKAFGRNVFTAFEKDTRHLELIKGALFDEGEVLRAIKGSDAVLSVLGGSFDGNDKTRTLGIKNIITQMKKSGVKRIIAVGGAGVLNADETTLIVDTENYPKEYIAVAKEHEQVFHDLNTSGLNWTLVCPPNIIDHEATGSFITNANYLPQPDNNSINSGDLALFMLNEIEKDEYVKQRVGISN